MGIGGIGIYRGAVVHSDGGSVRLAHINDQPARHTSVIHRGASMEL